MNRSNLLIVLLFVSSIMIGQEIEIRGVLLDSKTGQPIEFANIGVFNKNIGTVSNRNGAFRLVLSNDLANDSLTISHVSYESLKIPIAAQKNAEIVLRQKLNNLDEIVISNKRKKTRKIGVKSYNRLLWLSTTSRDNDILENSQRIRIPKKTLVKVKKVNFLLRKGFESDSCFIRINFYKNNNNFPGKKIIFENILKKKHIQPGWMSFDISNFDIYIKEDFFVGIEFIPDFKKERQIYIGAILSKGKGYSRYSSQGKWNKIGGASSINVEIEY